MAEADMIEVPIGQRKAEGKFRKKCPEKWPKNSLKQGFPEGIFFEKVFRPPSRKDAKALLVPYNARGFSGMAG
jgi:hypothetical protein